MSDADLPSLLAAAKQSPDAISAVCTFLLLPEIKSELLDEYSFDIFDAALPAAAAASPACLQHSERLLFALAENASAREVFTMVMEAFSTQPAPLVQLLLLRTLAKVLPRLQRKRADFIATCLGSLGARYLEHAWPGASWDDAQEEAEEDSNDATPWSSRLLPALLDCVQPLAEEAAEAALPESDGGPTVQGGPRIRKLVLGFLFHSLELARGAAGRGGDVASRVVTTLTQCKPTAEELEAAVAAATNTSSSSSTAELEPIDSTEALNKWPLRGIALYASGALQTTDVAPAPLAPALSTLSSGRRLTLLANLAACLLKGGAHGARGHTLLTKASEDATAGSLLNHSSSGSADDDEAKRAGAAMGAAIRALLAHMAGSSEQSERTASYATLRRVLWLWSASARLDFVRDLITGCPFPNVVALLVHRLKEEHLKEATDRAAVEKHMPYTTNGVFNAAALIDAVETLLVVPSGAQQGGHAADPLDSLDAWMAALNLVRLLLTRAKPPAAAGSSADSEVSVFAALPAARVADLKKRRLEPLDRWVKARMDALWAEIAAAEARTDMPPGALQEMRMSFTHLHVAVDVAARTVECAAW